MNKLLKSKNLLVCGIFFLSLNISVGQNPKLSLKLAAKHIGSNEGLGENHINSTFIDNKERICFLTNNKISSFENGQVNSQEFTQSYSNKGFNNITEDALGNLWLSENYDWFYPFNIQRLVVYNPRTKVTIAASKYIGKNLNLHSVTSDKEGLIYFSTKQGDIYTFEPHKKHLKKIFTSGNSPVKILYAQKGEIIICIEKTLRLDDKLLQINTQGDIIKSQNLSGKFVKSIIKFKNKTYYSFQLDKIVGLGEFGSRFEKSFKVSKDSYLASITYNEALKLFVINKGNGLDFLNENLQLIKSENYDFLIHHVNNDKLGNSFLATNNGVFILRLVRQKIKTFLENTDPQKINDNYSCRAILKLKDNQLLVNTNKRRQIIDLHTGKIRVLGQNLNKSDSDNKFILSVLKDKDGELLFGEDILLKTNTITGQNTVLCSLDSTKIWSMAIYENGLLLGLEKKGIIFYDKTKKLAKNYVINDANLKNSIVYDFFILSKDSVIIASEAGLYLLKNNSTFEALKFSKNGKAQISFFAIKKTKTNPKILILASSEGLWKYNTSTQAIVPFVKEKAFQNKKFLSAYDTKNGVWASSEEGVWHFNNSGYLLKIYTETDGLSSKECNRLSHFQDENDVLYFGGVNGINIIDPQNFSNQKETIYDLKVSDLTSYSDLSKSRDNLKIIDKSIALERDENSLSLKLNYEDYKYDCEKKYFYRNSQSLTKDWIALKDNTLLLDYVARGQTEIEIKVVSCDNFTESPTVKFTINRPPPIYQEWYFAPSFLIILGLLFWAFNKYSTYQLRRRNESLQRKIDRQTRTLQESLTLKETILSVLVHDVRYPVQSFYGLSKKLAYLTKKNDQERLALLGKETEEKSRKVLWLIDELVYWVKSTNKSETIIEEKKIGNTISKILEIFEEELRDKNLRISSTNLNCPIRADFGLLTVVLRNLIYNSIVHSKPNTEIKITLIHENEDYTLAIQNQNIDQNNKLNNGLGIGLSLLGPLLEKSKMKLNTELVEEVFTAKLKITNQI